MAFLRWLFNTAVTVIVTLLLVRALTEFMPGLNAIPLIGKLIRAWDPTLQSIFQTLGLPWSRDVRGLGLPAVAVGLIVARTMIMEAVDRATAPKRPPAPPRPAATAAAAIDPQATVLTGGTPGAPQTVRSVTGTGFQQSGPMVAGMVPQQIGRYEVLEELGHGAMGRVYKATDPKIGRTVAIKTLSAVGVGPEMEQYRARFLLEAKSAGRLNHPHIVAVYDVADDMYGRPCLVLEFVEGTTLDRMTSDAPLTLSQTLDFVSQIARALEYAHGHGIVHRDVKPANIMLTAHGQAKLSDFGIAKIEGTTLTIAGQVLGTPAFMSPEQCMGLPVDFRSDIFSLGTVLYTLLAGTKPFPGDTFTSVAYKVVHTEHVPLHDIDPKLPIELDDVLLRSLAKDPAGRYASAGRMADDIDAIRATLPRELAAAAPKVA
jgi:hypothetical protein